MSQKSPKIIKRYQNRKLYDTSDSCYVTLEDISDMVKAGEEVQVIDNTTKEDLTSVTLAQIIFEEEKKRKSALPLSTLTNIIRSGGETIKGFVQKSTVVRNFLDEKIKTTVHNVQNIPSVLSEIRALRAKIEELERKLRPHEKK